MQRRRSGQFRSKAEGEEQERLVYDKYLCDVYRATGTQVDAEIMVDYLGNRFIDLYTQARDQFYKNKITVNDRFKMLNEACDAFEKPLVVNGITTGYSSESFRINETMAKAHEFEYAQWGNKGDSFTPKEYETLCRVTMPFAKSYFRNYLRNYGSN